MIEANTCPYCGGPYQLYAPCGCALMRAHARMVQEAADGDPGEDGEQTWPAYLAFVRLEQERRDR